MNKMKKYKFRRYTLKFRKLFNLEKIKLKKIISNAKIEHVGSTAVPKLGGKGIIDIIISVPKKDINKTKNKLQKNNYILRPLAGDKDRLFFEKDYKYKKKTRRVHLHLTHNNSPIWEKCIAVRDYLRKDKREIKKYTILKKKAVKICKGDGKQYRKIKYNYLHKLVKRVLSKK